ncbi:MAG: preprotein translocase subunit YajC [Bacteroidales bacterium]|nr:preprotein translocase subunit YajC [Bacteroidales bacterium]
MNTLFLLLQATPKEGTGAGWGQLLPLFLILLVFYFFFIMPQTKKNKAQKKFREGLQKGDKVVTIGGIHGKVAEVKEKTVVLEIAPTLKITIEKSALSVDTESVGQK